MTRRLPFVPRTARSAAGLALLALLAACAGAAPPAPSATPAGAPVVASEPAARRSPREMEFPPLEFTLPRPERIELRSGARLLLLPDRELPLVDVVVLVRTGSVRDPAGKEGLGNLVGMLLRSGGTKTRAPEALDLELEEMAAQLSTGVDLEQGQANLSVLSRDLERGLAILVDVLRNPAFREDRFEIAKQRVLTAIAAQDDRPDAIARREFRRLLYGDHPYGRMTEGTAASVASITREDLMAFHARDFRPANVWVGVAGDFDRDRVVRQVEEALAGWQNDPESTWTLPAAGDDPAARRAYLYDRPVPQSVVRIGNLTVPLGHPDFVPLEVLNYVLGGGSFASRLNHEVRVKRGLAYSVGSGLSRTLQRGAILAGAGTKTESTAEVVDLLLSEFRRIRDEGVTPDEIENARASLLNSFVHRFANPAAVVATYADLDYNGLPPDYYDRWRARVATVTVEDVQRVAREHVKPERATVLVVGPRAQLEAPLIDLLGSVTPLP